MFPLFRNHLTRNAVAMFPLPLNPVASTEHERRDPHLPAVPRTENAEEEGRRVVLGVPELSKVYSTHHDDSSGATRPQDAAVEAGTCQELGKWHGKGKYVSAVWSHNQRQEEDHWNQQVNPKEIGDRREEASFQRDGGGRHRTGIGAGEIAGGSPFGSTSSPEQSDRSSIPSGEAMEEMSQIRNLLEANSEPVGQ